MRIKYKLVAKSIYQGDYDLNLDDMTSGYNEMLNEYWIKFPCGFLFVSYHKKQYQSVKDALTSILTKEVDDAILEDIGTIESAPGLPLQLRSLGSSAFFSNSRYRPLSPIPEVDEPNDDSNPWAENHSKEESRSRPQSPVFQQD